MRAKEWLKAIRSSILVGVATTFVATAAWANQTVVRYSNWLPTTHFLWAGVYKPYLDEIAKVTDGRVKVEVLPKVVGTAASQFDVVRDGLADMSFTSVSFTPGRFVSAEAGELPFMGDDATTMAPAYFRHFKKFIEPRGEFDGVKVLSIWIHSPLQPHSRHPIRALKDFRGQKLRTSTPNLTMALELLGAIPILKSAAEVVELLSTGAIDGQVTVPNVIMSFNTFDFHKSVTLIPGGLSNAATMMFINPDKWAKISPQDQSAIEAISGEKLAEATGRAYVEQDRAALERFREKGYEIITPDDAFLEGLRMAVEPVEDAWIERAKARGIADPRAELEALRAEIAASANR